MKNTLKKSKLFITMILGLVLVYLVVMDTLGFHVSQAILAIFSAAFGSMITSLYMTKENKDIVEDAYKKTTDFVTDQPAPPAKIDTSVDFGKE